MTDGNAPASYVEWRSDEPDRAETAANTFGYHLMIHCRDEALATLPTGASDSTRAAVENAVDLALHNVTDLLEGFWPLPSGENHSIEYVLSVRVQNRPRVHDEKGEKAAIPRVRGLRSLSRLRTRSRTL